MSDLYATFLDMEAEAKRAVARKNKLAVGLLSFEETHAIARRAAEAHAIPWEDARSELIDNFATRAN